MRKIIHTYDDADLVVRAQGGERSAFDLLIARYEQIVSLKSSLYFIIGGEKEDLLQEGYIGLIKAIRDFEISNGASFRTFAELCIVRQMITAIKTARRKKHQPLNNYLSFTHVSSQREDLDVTLSEIIPDKHAVDPLSRLIDNETIQRVQQCIEEELSEKEAGVFRLYLADHSYEQIASQTGCKTKSVDNTLNRVKRKMDLLEAS